MLALCAADKCYHISPLLIPSFRRQNQDPRRPPRYGMTHGVSPSRIRAPPWHTPAPAMPATAASGSAAPAMPATAASGNAATEIVASMAAATVFPCALNWTDVIKTRMQTPPASKSCAVAYSGAFGDTARRIMAEEGLLRLWGTGMPASLMREVLVVGTRVGAYPAVRDAIAQIGASPGEATGRGEAGLGSKLAAGLLLGAVSGLMAGPCDVVRIRMQAEAGLSDASGTLTTGLRAGLQRRLHNTPQAFAAVFGEAGIRRGLLRGASANILHSCCITVGTVPVYEHTKYLAKTRLGWSDGMQLHATAGLVAGLVGTTVVRPMNLIDACQRDTCSPTATQPGTLSDTNSC